MDDKRIYENGFPVMNDCSFKNSEGEEVDGKFMGTYQFSDVIVPAIARGGHPGGTIAYPIALVRVGNEIKEIRASLVKMEISEEGKIRAAEELQEHMKAVRESMGFRIMEDE
jgi:hypothetical protein